MSNGRPPFFDESLGTELNSVEQHFDLPNQNNNSNKQRPLLIHTQNNNVDPDDQIYNCDNQEYEPYFPIRAELWTNDTPKNDEQSINIVTYTKETMAQIHLPPSDSLPNNKNDN